MRSLTILCLAALLAAGCHADDATDESSPGRDPLGLRVELVKPSIGISFPDHWTVESLRGRPDVGVLRMLDPETLDPDAHLEPVLMAYPAGADSPGSAGEGPPPGCLLVSYRPTDATPDDFMDLVGGGFDDETVEAAGLTVDAPAAGMARLRPRGDLSETWEQYAIAAGDGLAHLWCRGPDDPGELWLAIAESVKSLPGKG